MGKRKIIADFFSSKTRKKKKKGESKQPREEESRLSQCPICRNFFHFSLIERHAAGCYVCGDDDLDTEEETLQNHHQHSQHETIVLADEKTDDGRNAFDVLKHNQQLSSCKKTFRLKRKKKKSVRAWTLTLQSGSSQGKTTTKKSLFSGSSMFKEHEVGGVVCESAFIVKLDDDDDDDDSPYPRQKQEEEQEEKQQHWLSESILASALQKNVRRNRVGAAYRIARAMCEKSLETFTQCVRRLMIIACEDGTALKEMPFLAWLLVALTKKFLENDEKEASRFCKREVARIAGELAAQEYRDSAHDISNDLDNSEEEGDDDDDVLPTISSIQEKLGDNTFETQLVVALIVRAHFGGMKGDVQMLKSFVKLWRSRFLDETKKKIWLDRILRTGSALSDSDIEQFRNMSLSKYDVPLEAIGFHCSDVIEYVLSDEKSDEFIAIRKLCGNGDVNFSLVKARELARSAMWHCSSGVNLKLFWDCGKMGDEEKQRELQPIFQILAKDICQYSMRSIAERFENQKGYIDRKK